MAYAYLFKYIIIGDTGKRESESVISAVLESMTWLKQGREGWEDWEAVLSLPFSPSASLTLILTRKPSVRSNLKFVLHVMTAACSYNAVTVFCCSAPSQGLGGGS